MKRNDKLAYEQAIYINELQILLCDWKGTQMFKQLCENFGGDSNYIVPLFKRKDAKWLFRWCLLCFRIRKMLGIPYPFFEFISEETYLETQYKSIWAYEAFLYDIKKAIKSGVVEL